MVEDSDIVVLRRRRRRWPWVLLGFALLFAAVVLLLPFGIKWYATRWLHQHGQVNASIEGVGFNPFTGRLGVVALKTRPGETGQMDLAQGVVRVDWWPLWRRRLQIEALSLSGVVLDVERSAEGTLRIARLSIGGEEEASPPPTGEKTSDRWGIGVGSVDLRDVLIRYRDPALRADVLVHRLHLDPMATWKPETASGIDADLEINGGRLRLKGSATPFSPRPTAALQVGVEKLPLAWLGPELPERETKLDGTLDLDATLKGAADRKAGSGSLHFDGGWSVAGLRVMAPTQTFHADEISFRGNVTGSTSPGGKAGLRGAQGDPQNPEVPSEHPDGRATPSGDAVPMERGRVTRLQGSVEVDVKGAAVPEATLETASLAWNGEVESGGEPGALSARGELTLSRLSLLLQSLGVRGALDRLAWKGDAGLSKAEGGSLRASGELGADGVVVTEAARGRQLLSLGHTEVKGLQVRGPGAATAEVVRLQSVEALARPKAEKAEAAHVLTLKEVRLEKPAFADGQEVGADAVRLEGLRGWLVRTRDGAMEWRTLLPAELTGGHPKGQADPPGQGGLSVRAGLATIGEGSGFTFRDESVEPRVALTADPIELTVKDVDTSTPQEPVALSLAVDLGHYGKAKADGDGTPFASPPGGTAQVTLDGINLSPFSPYAEKYLGYRLRAGQLDLRSDAKVREGNLDATNQLVLHQLGFDRIGPEEGELTRGLGMPLNTALSLLRDRDGDIRLSIPVQGDVTRPDIGIGDAVRKAIVDGLTEAIKVAALAFFAPVGAVFAVGKLVSLATALRFQPVLFVPGQTKLDGEAEQYLSHLAKLLTERPQVQLQLCPYAVPADVKALQAAAKAKAPPPGTPPSGQGQKAPPAQTVPAGRGEQAPAPPSGNDPPPASEGAAPAPAKSAKAPPPPPVISEQQLLDLARSRSEAMKAYLVKQGGIDPKRLLVCTPEVERDEAAKPRVAISL